MISNNCRKAVFFDRDGIVNKRIIDGYVTNYSDFHFIPEFFEIFKFFKNKSFLAILVTNQQGIGKGLMTHEQLDDIHDKMQKDILIKTNYRFDKIYFAPQLAHENSIMRKPNPGMLLKAIEEFNIDIVNSWTIGDGIRDVIAGKKAKTKTILVGNFESIPDADFICKNHSETIKLLHSLVL